MNEFESLPLTAAQISEEQIDPGFSVPPTDNNIDPDFSVMPPYEPVDPDFSVMPPYEPIDPDFSVTPPYEPIDPDFSVMPPYEPIDPDFSVMPPSYPIVPPYVPCLFCSNNQWVRGSIRLLNAATGYNPFSIWIDGRLASSRLGFPEITRYNLTHID